jgi:hypothetical protein
MRLTLPAPTSLVTLATAEFLIFDFTESIVNGFNAQNQHYPPISP